MPSASSTIHRPCFVASGVTPLSNHKQGIDAIASATPGLFIVASKEDTMPQEGSPYGRPSSSSVRAHSLVVDLENCFVEEMASQAGILPHVPQLPFLKMELFLHQKKNVRRMIDLEEQGRSVLQMDTVGMGKTRECWGPLVDLRSVHISCAGGVSVSNGRREGPAYLIASFR